MLVSRLCSACAAPSFVSLVHIVMSYRILEVGRELCGGARHSRAQASRFRHIRVQKSRRSRCRTFLISNRYVHTPSQRVFINCSDVCRTTESVHFFEVSGIPSFSKVQGRLDANAFGTCAPTEREASTLLDAPSASPPLDSMQLVSFYTTASSKRSWSVESLNQGASLPVFLQVILFFIQACRK